MALVIYCKIGTWSSQRLPVVRKRKLPIVGETFEVREVEHSPRGTRVRCTDIKDLGGGEILYYLERI
jgi:hypothetical protein